MSVSPLARNKGTVLVRLHPTIDPLPAVIEDMFPGPTGLQRLVLYFESLDLQIIVEANDGFTDGYTCVWERGGSPLTPALRDQFVLVKITEE